MLNPFKDINWRPDRRDIRSFGRTMLIGAVLIAVIFVSTGVCSQNVGLIIAGGGFVCWLIALLAPATARPLYYVWFFLGACVGIVISNLVLLIIFFLIFSPLAIIVRLLGRKDFLDLNKGGWHNHERVIDLSRYFKQF